MKYNNMRNAHNVHAKLTGHSLKSFIDDNDLLGHTKGIIPVTVSFAYFANAIRVQ